MAEIYRLEDGRYIALSDTNLTALCDRIDETQFRVKVDTKTQASDRNIRMANEYIGSGIWLFADSGMGALDSIDGKSEIIRIS